MAVGDSQYLGETGKMPGVQSEEEAEDPPGERLSPSTMSVGDLLDVKVMDKRKTYVWVRTPDKVWGRIYPGPDLLGLVCVGDIVAAAVVLEVRDKCVLLENIFRADNEPGKSESDQEDGEEQWDLPSTQVGDRISASVKYFDADALEVWLELKNYQQAAVLTEPTDYMEGRG